MDFTHVGRYNQVALGYACLRNTRIVYKGFKCVVEGVRRDDPDVFSERPDDGGRKEKVCLSKLVPS